MDRNMFLVDRAVVWELNYVKIHKNSSKRSKRKKGASDPMSTSGNQSMKSSSSKGTELKF
jgi:hypothetical protein